VTVVNNSLRSKGCTHIQQSSVSEMCQLLVASGIDVKKRFFVFVIFK